MSEKTKNKNKDLGKGCLMIIVLIIIFSFAIGFGTGNGNGNGDEGIRKSEAYVQVQFAVEDRLKSPGSASFPLGRAEEQTTQLDETTFRVRSYVDSENAYGAEIRTQFEAEVEKRDEQWYLNYLKFD